ncbi:MAG: TRAP transporter large permease [Bdellovibrio sp.]|nr:TRAP transporter large permease [Bdellovibrio sp.]
MLGLGLALLILVLVILGQPLFVLIGSVTAYCFHFYSDESLKVIIGDIFFAGDKEVLLAVPLFVLAGNLMTQGTIAKRLIRLASAVTAPIPSGLAIAAVMSCSIFAAISGSSPVTLIAVGSILYPALSKAGYDKNLSIGLLSAGGTLGIIIPPSIPMIIFAIMASVSVVDLFKAGIGPGIVLSILLMIFALLRGGKKSRGKLDKHEVWESFKQGILSLLMPVIILGGIYTGFFTATESAGVAVVYALLVEFLIHREMKVKQLPKVFSETALMLGTLFLILLLAVSLNKFMTYEQIPQSLVEKLSGLINSKFGFWIGVNILLLIVGCFMDIMSAILVLAPLLTPMAVHFGINPIHFGIVMIVNLEIGYLTPPVGINLFVASSIFNEPLGKVIKAVMPLVLTLLIGLMIITFVPSISLFFLSK